MLTYFYIHDVGHYYYSGFLICELVSIVKVLGKLGAVAVVPLHCRKYHQCVYSPQGHRLCSALFHF